MLSTPDIHGPARVAFRTAGIPREKLAFNCLEDLAVTNLFNPHIIYWLVTLYTIYLPALFYSEALISDNYFNTIFLLGTLGGVLGLVLIPIRPAVLESKTPKNNKLHFIIFFLALIYGIYLLGSVLNIIYSRGGILSALIYSRLDIYLKGA